MSTQDHVDLGFVEKTDDWKLLSHLFPSKVGGKPAWLSLKPLPNADVLKCEICSEPCVFLLQLYAPLNDKNSFHRALFVFICRNPQCCKVCNNKNLVVLRSDLPRKNDFYSFAPPTYDTHDASIKHPSAVDYQKLCVVCGCVGKETCSCCDGTFCSKIHQDCTNVHKCPGSGKISKAGTSCQIFTEFGLDISGDSEDESSDDDDSGDEEGVDDANDVERRMREFGMIPQDSDFLTEVLDQMAFGETDKSFERFKKVVQKDPDQVIRHNRGGEPLWITEDCKLQESDIPKCQYCGSKRTFEFQVMPQLLSKLNVENAEQSIDWGILAIYTCSKNCTGSDANYRKEFIYKQDFQPRK